MDSKVQTKARKTNKMRLFFFATPLSRGQASEKTTLDWTPGSETQNVRRVRVNKVDNSG